MRIAVVNLKGGSGKTTTSMWLASELAKRGETVLIDADPQGSALAWTQQAEARGQKMPFAVQSMPHKEIHKKIKEIPEATHVVIDSPPGHIDIVQSSLLAADIALIPLSPSLMEIDRMRPALQVIAQIESFKPDLKVRMLFNRIRRGTNSYKAARQFFAARGFPVLDTEVAMREVYVQAFGMKPGRSPEYEDVLHELLDEPREWEELLTPKPKAPATPAPAAPALVSEEKPAATAPAVTESIPASPPAPAPAEPQPVAAEPVRDEPPRRRQTEGGSGELAPFTDPLAKVFQGDGDENPRPPYLRR